MRVRAHAKVNLSLEVTGRRPDGYHDLVSVMQTVDLADDIDISPAAGVQFTCSDPSLANDENLVPRAALLLRDTVSPGAGCALHLEKHVPYAAGLGGGSSDAAATLRALNIFWGLGLSGETLAELGLRLGSDVPFCLLGGTALVSGRGEHVMPLPEPEPAWMVLAKPPIAVSTGTIFSALPCNTWADGAATRALAGQIVARRRAGIGVNTLQRTIFDLYPAARECFDDLARVAPGRVIVSGSGPTVAAICTDRREAEALASRVRRPGRWTRVVSTVGSNA